jgi:hypothetical protein
MPFETLRCRAYLLLQFVNEACKTFDVLVSCCQPSFEWDPFPEPGREGEAWPGTNTDCSIHSWLIQDVHNTFSTGAGSPGKHAAVVTEQLQTSAAAVHQLNWLSMYCRTC